MIRTTLYQTNVTASMLFMLRLKRVFFGVVAGIVLFDVIILLTDAPYTFWTPGVVSTVVSK